MVRGVRWYLVGSFVLVSLAGCSHGFFSEEREPWRAEAEVACLKSGAVREGPDLVRISPISGPGACGADFPLRVSALGESSASYGFADDDLRPPATIGNQPRWPASQPPQAYQSAPPSPPPPPPSAYYPDQPYRARNYGGSNYGPDYGPPSNGPVSLRAPPDQNDIPLPPASYQPPRLGPGPINPSAASGPVGVRPAATLACPLVSALDHWLTDTVQPAAQRWLGQRVVEIKQISAYSCRGMNGNPNAHISEHAFGNALDIAAFTLADGRHVTVKDGWHGLPEEQGFLRDVEAGACQQFSTVLAPGSNAYHYDHIHVDLMRRASRRLICQPAAVSGEEVAARAMQRNPYASRETSVTGSLSQKQAASRRREKINEEDEFEDE